MTPPLSLAWIPASELVHGVLYPSQYSPVATVILQNRAQELRLARYAESGQLTPRAEALTGVRLHLTFADAVSRELLLEQWPLAGCGVEASFDQGVTWVLFRNLY